jgi:hypothetical protein
MIDPETKEYFRTIEAHFTRLRQSPMSLSSNDFHRICRWKEQAIPLPIVLRGLDRYFSRIKDNPRKKRWFISVAFCENDILDLWEEHLVKSIGASEQGATGSDGRTDRRDRLSDVAASLGELASKTKSSGRAKLAADLRKEARNLQSLLEADWEGKEALLQIERALVLSGARIAKKLALLVDEEKLSGFRAEAVADLEDYRHRMDPKAFKGLLEKLLQKKIREHFGLPDYTLASLI